MTVREAYYSQPGSGLGYSTFNSRLPSIYSVEIASYCSLSCEFCPRGQYPDQFIDIGLAQTIAERDLKGSEFIEFQLTGEPTLHPKFNEIVDLFSGRVFLGTSTNGNSMHKALPGLLKLNYITVSVDSVTNYENVRKGGKWSRLESGLRALLEAKGDNRYPKIDLQFIELDKSTLHEAWLMKELVHSWGYERRCTIRTIPDCFAAVQDRMPMRPKKELCLDPWLSCVVQADGDVVPCCFAFSKQVCYGNLNHQSLEEIWHTSPALMKLREEHLTDQLTGACAKCYMRSPVLLHKELMWQAIKRDVLERPV